MPSQLMCPACTEVFQVGDGQAPGTPIQCPNCKATFRRPPAARGGPPAEPPAERPQPPPAPAQPTPVNPPVAPSAPVAAAAGGWTTGKLILLVSGPAALG